MSQPTDDELDRLDAVSLSNDTLNALVAEVRSLRAEVERLATFIIEKVDGEPSQSQGAVDAAIRVIKRLTEESADLRASREEWRTKRSDEISLDLARLTEENEQAKRTCHYDQGFEAGRAAERSDAVAWLNTDQFLIAQVWGDAVARAVGRGLHVGVAEAGEANDG